MSTILAAPHTLTIVDAACGADPGVAPAIRERILEILRTGVAASGSAARLTERETSACIGISKSQLNRWRRGQKTAMGPFPFHPTLDPTGSRWVYDRREVTDYVHAMLSTRVAPLPPQQGA